MMRALILIGLVGFAAGGCMAAPNPAQSSDPATLAWARSVKVSESSELWQLSEVQARALLVVFLDEEATAFKDLQIGSINLDYSQRSVVALLYHVSEEIEAGRLNEEQRNIWFARAGYYFGESLRRAKPALRWGLGDSRYAFANHPVIAGFSGNEEAPVITISRNLIESVAKKESPPTRIDDGVRRWFDTGAGRD
jgi:hypothetical protein